jgi:hydroxyacylglutathione hydrolase
VRSDEEWDAGHLAGASYISYDWDHRLEPLKALPEDRPILVYCEAGGRSGVITEELRIIGHPYIIDLIGGISEWTEADLPVVYDKPVALP